MLWCNAALVQAPRQIRGWGSTVWPAYLQALEAYDLRLFEAGRFGRPVAEGTDELLDQAVKSLDRRAMQLHTVAFQMLWQYLFS
jgi:hypothetical protein